MPTEDIYHIETVEQITTKLERAATVISLVDEDGMSFKAFSTSSLEKDRKDFGEEEWFIKYLGQHPSSRNQGQSYYHFEVMWC